MSKSHTKNKPNYTKVAKQYSLLTLGLILVVSAFILNIYVDKKDSSNTVVEVNKVEPTPVPTVEQIVEYPVASNFTSKSYVVYDVNSKKIVAGKDIDKKVANASTTKLMSALIAYNEFPLDKIITVPETCLGIDGSNANFYALEQYYFEDMLYAILLRSAADATCAVSVAYKNGSSDFITKMNDKAKELGLLNTNYQNAIGLDAPDHYSTSRDLLKLILNIKDINKLNIVMGTRFFTLNELKTGRDTYVANTNEMLFKLPGSVGYKTGTTSNAGECLVYGYNNANVNLIIVVMGSENRFYDAANLLDIYLAKSNVVNKPFIQEATKIFTPSIPTPSPVLTIQPSQSPLSKKKK